MLFSGCSSRVVTTQPFEVKLGETTDVAVMIQRSPVPILSDVSVGGVPIGTPVTASSSRSGVLHLVPSSTLPRRSTAPAE